MEKYIYWTEKGKFETVNYWLIPWDELHSPNEETPALIWKSGTKVWYFEGKKHRLTGPAEIYNDGRKYFWLNSLRYNFEHWLRINPNQDEIFQAFMKLKYS